MAQKRVQRFDEQMAVDKDRHTYTSRQFKSLEISDKQLTNKEFGQAGYSFFHKDLIMSSVKFFGVIVTVGIFVLLWRAFYPIDNHNLDLFETNALAYLEALTWILYTILVMWLGRIYHAYEVGETRVFDIIYSQALANSFSGGIIFILVCLARQQFIVPLPLLAIVVAQIGWSSVWNLAADRIFFRLYPPQPTAIICRSATDFNNIEQTSYFSSRFDVLDRIENPDSLDALLEAIKGKKVVFIAGVEASLRDKVIAHCLEEGIQCYLTPKVSDIVMAGAKHMQMFSTPFMYALRAQPSPGCLLIKRAFDIVGSIIGIIVTSPIMLITALAIKVCDGGPVIYKQVRLTQGRHKFQILKFRSMRVDSEKDGVARLAGIQDNRITPVGKFIRAARIDELPQLFNILRGDMTIVGPRPERPEIAEQYEKTIPEFALRLQVKAGLTGYAQVYGRYNTEPMSKLQMDLMYINKMSLAEDMRLIFATIKILFLPESTEGVAAGQTTAMENNYTDNDV